jgi:hypothetical protein
MNPEEMSFTDYAAWLQFVAMELEESRLMTDWERKSAADFFWSEMG